MEVENCCLLRRVWLNRRTEEVLSSRGGFATDYKRNCEECKMDGDDDRDMPR